MEPDARIDFETLGAGRPIVFVHGLTFDRALLREASEPVFVDTTRPFPRPCARRIYVDLPGHGATPADECAASAEGLVEALCALISATCAAPPVVVGHSYGGYLALGVAACLPVAGLVLVTPVVEPDLGRRVVRPRRVARVDEGLCFSAPEAERATFEEIAVVQSAEVLAAYQRLVQPASERTDRAFLDAVRSRYVLPVPIVSRLPADLPTLIVCGRDDHWVGFEDTLPLLRALLDCQLVVLPSCGQLLPVEAADDYRALLAGFLARLGPSST